MTTRCRRLVPILLVLAWASSAWAEEVFVLDDGTVLRGEAIQESEDSVRIRLTGLAEGEITVEALRIRSRIEVLPGRPPPPRMDALPDWASEARPHGAEAEGGEGYVLQPPSLPEEEPEPSAEGFFERLQRVTRLAMPDSPSTRGILVALGVVALFSVILMGAGVAEIEGMRWSAALVLALVMGAFLVVDILHYDELLRADRAWWVLPLQAALWLAAAQGLLRCGMPRATLLLAFVVFVGGVFAFMAGAVLVSF